jgi:uncharacterized membrane protein YoaT (DUF817 family)
MHWTWRDAVAEFCWFGLKEARACVFAGSFFIVLWASSRVPLGALPRYDAILLGALVLQAAMLALKLETPRELATICLFHVFGFTLEVFKTHPAIGSWSYPEPGYTKLFGVPLYSGFMYAAVASYMIQAWRLFDLELTGEPPPRLAHVVALAIYFNFFTHHFIGDWRYVLAALLAAIYSGAWVHFTPWRRRVRMPLLLSFVLIGFFIWLAENVATGMHAWVYPHQAAGWNPVHHGKIGSWTLLAVLTFVLVAGIPGLRHTTAARESARCTRPLRSVRRSDGSRD